MVQLTISAAAKLPLFARGFPIQVDVKPGATVADVKASIAAKFPEFYSERQKVTVKGERKALDDETKVLEVLEDKEKELQVKDLGPQLGWRTVFIIEYLGPILIHPLFYHLPQLFYGQDVQHSQLQTFVYAFVMLHFTKRELETIFVHRFSHGTMPASYVFRNSAHYWILSGLFLALDIYRPVYSATSPSIRGTIRENETFLWAMTGLWAFAEVSNFHTHLTLRSLRPAGSRVRNIPYGYGFNLVSCPNYFFETLGWFFVSVMTGSISVWLFVAVSLGIMTNWALQKHKNYRNEFGKEYPRNRKAIIPFII
ncbi:hypothetical protein BDN72DRAFT_213988 [Pluteus cervinus]|uniref:Uncharacterized protein n=1 Tax=Pluteus cervinus TaxID=181527 RepID=A0ACD3B6J6_9AGAR|nr:hypothetical protein BDN72DRAFT_213988 [Pluteus cervinus]